MANNNAANVAMGKPKAGGAIFRAVGTIAEIPTTATAALGAEFKNLGYASEDGLTNAVSTDSTSIKDWSGQEVLKEQTSREESFKFTLIETNAETLNAIYGEENVSVVTDSIAVIHNGAERVYAAYVFEILLGSGRVKRIFVPRGMITEVGDITYKNGEPIGYEVTVSAMPDTEGNTAYSYIAETV